jgi:hypothetical protein
MDKNVGTVVTANESETFRVIEPLDLTEQTNSPPFLAIAHRPPRWVPPLERGRLAG